MIFLKELVLLDNQSGTPIYLQITNSLIHAIRAGHLHKGQRLPGSRELAALLQINRMTVVAAFDELQAQGWIELLPRKGTFVVQELPVLQPKVIKEGSETYSMPKQASFAYREDEIVPIHIADFPKPDKLVINDGFPDPRLAPVEELMRSMRSLSRLATHKKYLMYGGAMGTDLLRDTIAGFLRDTRGLPISKDNILITRGAQMGIYLAAYAILKPGDEVVVGEPNYPGANLTFKQLGVKINYVPIDQEGMQVDALDTLCKTKKIKVVYVIPHHHNPTTVTLSPKRRIKLLELAARYGFAVMEDDYDYDFHYASKPLMPMASLDRHGSVIYIGTLTKTFAPAIRMGFLIGPENFVQAAAYLRKVIDTQGDSFMENALAGLYEDGTLTRYIKKSVKTYRERRDHFCALLQSELGDHIKFEIPDGGMSVWVAFPNADLKRVAERALAKNLIMKDGTSYDRDGHRYNAVRMGFASLNLEEQRKVVSILKEILDDM